MGAFLNGRVTYELMAGFWPTAVEPDVSHELFGQVVDRCENASGNDVAFDLCIHSEVSGELVNEVLDYFLDCAQRFRWT